MPQAANPPAIGIGVKVLEWVRLKVVAGFNPALMSDAYEEKKR